MDALKISQNRVYSMALVHEQLYQSQALSEIDMNSYIRLLVDELQANYPGHNLDRTFNITINAGSMRLSIEYAIPCGLILNELVTNALTHAFPEPWWSNGKQAEIMISLEKKPNGYTALAVQDNGIGLPDHNSITDEHSLGMQLVRILSKQLKGDLQITSNHGTDCRITFPYDSAGNGSG
jgi:two-component sensor histidine kinase